MSPVLSRPSRTSRPSRPGRPSRASAPSRTSRPPRRLLALVTGLVLSLTGVGAGATAQAAGPPTPPDVSTADGLLRWMADNRDHVGLSVVPDGRPPSIQVNARGRFPLASVRKVAIAGALVDSGADLTDTVPRAEVERFYVPGVDPNHLEADLDPVAPTLQQLLDAMLSLSDNAASDTLLDRVGAPAVDRWARRHGLLHQDPAMPLLGEFAAWGTDPGWIRRTPADRARRAIALARTTDGTAVRATLPGADAQYGLAAVSEAGTPAEWARLLSGIGRCGAPALVTALDWPRRQAPGTAAAYDRYLAKGGTLLGVVTEADYVKPAGRPGTAAALFLRDLPADVQAGLAASFSQQELLRRIAEDPAYARKVARVLRG
ncbi:serine hydrolase [Patulibacter sp.]|uniref:serine hydrolase n=1 Tax=Patulibacter sp. TaxID=1912859 RepID=UPI00271D385E|nr:serine hydrolase [Patulibacter sp.]MDO9407320.1 serine hydrolase [Patulibacter sp.]